MSAPPSDLRQRLAQLIFPRIGSNLPPVRTVDQDADRIAKLIDQEALGGLCLFNGPWPAVTETLDRLQRRAAFPMLIASDLERGAGQQLPGLTLFPHALAFDALGADDLEAVEAFARQTATEARLAGVQVVFGPVVDIDSNSKNPIIATRSFGHDPAIVAARITTYIRAAQGAGLLCTAKHFPGHGDTSEDSHDAFPVLGAPLTVLEQRELVPFRAAIDAGVALVMSAHLASPALDPSGAAATVSRPMLLERLRAEMGFQGAVVSDSLLMTGIRGKFETETEMCLAALLAGVDILLDVAQPSIVLDGLIASVQQGTLPEVRVADALTRVWRLKSWVRDHPLQAPLGLRGSLDNDGLEGVRAQGSRLAQSIADRAIVSIGRDAHFSLKPSGRIGVLITRPFRAPWDPPEAPLITCLRDSGLSVVPLDIGPDDMPTDSDLQAVLGCEQVIVAMIVKPAAWQRFGLSPSQRRCVGKLLGAPRPILVSLGVPEILNEFPGVADRWCAFSDVPATQAAVVRRLLRQPGL